MISMMPYEVPDAPGAEAENLAGAAALRAAREARCDWCNAIITVTAWTSGTGQPDINVSHETSCPKRQEKETAELAAELEADEEGLFDE